MKLKINILLAVGIIFIANVVYAKDPPSCASGQTCIPDPLNGIGSDPNLLIGTIINGVLGVVGSLALVMFIYGGFTWMMAAGNNERVTKGKNILLWATIGLVIIFSAYAIVKFVFTTIGVTS